MLVSNLDAEAVLEELGAAIAAVGGADEPYWAAEDVRALASSSMTEFGVSYRVWWMWSALADWYELNPQQRPEALAAMRRAADEWIDVAADENARDAYLQRWMFDVLGLDRSIGREF